MSARFRSTCTVYRYTESKDEVGGVVKTRTTVYDGLPLQISSSLPSQSAVQQGIEVQATFTASVRGRWHGNVIDIHENDELDVQNAFLGGTFLVIGVQTPVIKNGTSIHMTLRRTRRSRRQTF